MVIIWWYMLIKKVPGIGWWSKIRMCFICFCFLNPTIYLHKSLVPMKVELVQTYVINGHSCNGHHFTCKTSALYCWKFVSHIRDLTLWLLGSFLSKCIFSSGVLKRWKQWMILLRVSLTYNNSSYWMLFQQSKGL